MKHGWLLFTMIGLAACSGALDGADDDTGGPNEAPEPATEPDASSTRDAQVEDASDTPSKEDADAADAVVDADASADANADAETDADADAAPACERPYARCVYKVDTELDRQSARQVAGSGCGFGPSFVPSAVCDFTERCNDDTDPVASCVSCGAEGARHATRFVDGTLVDECRGCGCSGWAVYGCYAETATYGQPWVDVVWQKDFDVMRFAVLQDGQVLPSVRAGWSASVLRSQLRTFQVQPDGLVDWEIALDVSVVDDVQQTHAWSLDARVVGRCD